MNVPRRSAPHSPRDAESEPPERYWLPPRYRRLERALLLFQFALLVPFAVYFAVGVWSLFTPDCYLENVDTCAVAVTNVDSGHTWQLPPGTSCSVVPGAYEVGGHREALRHSDIPFASMVSSSIWPVDRSGFHAPVEHHYLRWDVGHWLALTPGALLLSLSLVNLLGFFTYRQAAVAEPVRAVGSEDSGEVC